MKHLAALIFLITVFNSVCAQQKDSLAIKDSSLTTKDTLIIKKLEILSTRKDSLQLEDSTTGTKNKLQNFRAMASASSSSPDANTLGNTPGNLSVSLTGSATYTIPIAVAPGINNVQPNITLAYNSQGGNGIAGWGWNISGISTITRISTTKFHDGKINAVEFSADDRFALDGQRLILKSGTYGANDAVYETENYSNLRITSYGTSSYGAGYGPASFTVNYPDGSVAYYGLDASTSTQMDYALSYVENPQGLRISYSYIKSNNGLSISSIKYGSRGQAAPINEIQFVYTTRNRPEQNYIGGIGFIRSNLLSQIKVLGSGLLIRSYNLSYDNNSASYNRLTNIQEFNANGEGKNPINFNYANSSGVLTNGTTYNLSVNNIEQRNAETVSMDFDGDGKMDFLVYPTTGADAKKKFWLFTGMQYGSTQYGWDINIGAFKDIFPVTWLTWNNKQLPGQGLATIQEDYNNTKFKIYSSSGTTPVLYQYEKKWNFPTTDGGSGCNGSVGEVSIIPQKYISGDFNGDGLTDVMAIGGVYTYTNGCIYVRDPVDDRASYYSDDASAVSSPSCYFINLDRRINENYVTAAGDLPEYGDRLLTADFDGDGKTDILCIRNGQIKVYGLDNNLQLRLLWTSIDSRISTNFAILLGDYNGDGKTDIMMPQKNGTSTFNILLSTGKTFSYNTINSFYYLESAWLNSNNLITRNFIPTDINGDGKTDIVAFYASTYNNGLNGSQSVQVYTASIDASSNLPTFNSAGYVSRNGNYKHFPIPIFIPSNRPNYSLDFASISDNQVTSFQLLQDNREDVLLRSVTNNGITQNINYQNIDINTRGVNGSSSIYSSTGQEIYPNTDLSVVPGTKIVTNLERTGVGTPIKQTFSYESAVSNTEGLGFLGFKKVARSNWFTDYNNQLYNITYLDPSLRGAVTKEFTSKLSYIASNITDASLKPANITLSVPAINTQTVEAGRSIRLLPGFSAKGANGTFIARITSNTTGVNDGATSNDYVSRTDYQYQTELRTNKVFVNAPTVTAAKDLLNGTNTTQYIKYDDYFNPVEQTVQYSNDGSKTVKTNFTNNTGTNYFIGRPDSKATTTSAASDSYTTEEQYSYTGYLPTTIKTRGNNTGYITENRQYDAFGNITQKTITPDGETPRTAKYEYDASGRFITKVTDADGLATLREYNTSTGNLIKETNTYGLSVTYQYDAWGRPVKATDYLNNNATTTYQRSGYETVIAQASDDGGGREQYYDALSRLYKSRQKNVMGQWVEKSYTYDYLDRKVAESEPYIGSPSQWNTTEYDLYGRVTKMTAYTGKVINYTYNGLSVTINDGIKSITTQKNAIGNTIQQTDPGGTITYGYFANGNLKSSNFDGTTISIEQDGWGRKTKLTDPSAGTYTYSYNGYGEVTQETTPKGTTNYSYGAAGKLLNKTITGDNANIQIQNSYDAITKLITAVTFTNVDGNNSSYSYAYDNYKRLSSTTETNAMARFTKNYTFDNFGRTATEYFEATSLYNNRTASKKITNSYQNGALKSIADEATGELIWAVNAVDAKGQITQAALGSQILQTNTYDSYGFPAEFKTAKTDGSELMKLSYNFNAVRGVLNNRANTAFNWNENFEYDNLDRLTTFNDNNGNKTQAYDNKGRITNNSILGNYSYNGNSYRQAMVMPTDAAKPLYTNRPLQQISFNAFKKPVEIYEEGRERIGFQYNVDMQRAHMYYGSDAPDKMQRPYRRHYSADGGMEITYHGPTDKTTFVFYLDGDGYDASAIWHVEQGGGTAVGGGSSGAIFYLHRDYLGSIVMITDKAGNVKEKRQFDAWGNIVKLQDGAGNNLASFPILDRGYTGHEHILALTGGGYALINMNGRLYDPIAHIFLNPDDNIQDLLNSQNFNRYGYGLNNPLMYKDPNGEFLNIIIGALIGGAVNLVSGILTGKIHNFWDGLKYFGVGALSGAIGAGVGSGVSSMLAGGSFGAGFVGSSLAKVATTSFFNGALIGAAGGFSGGFVGGMGNSLIEGQGFGDAFSNGLKIGAIAGVSGGIVNGIYQGIDAVIDGRRFFDGAKVTKTILADQNIPVVGQRGDNNCLGANVESVDKSYGGNMTQEQARNLVAPGSDPNIVPLGDKDVWSAYGNASNHGIEGMRNYGGLNIGGGNVQGPVTLNDITSRMSAGQRVSLGLNNTGSNVGHSVVVKSVIGKLVTKVDGSTFYKVIYRVMDPANGGSFRNILGSGLPNYIPSNVNNVFFIK